MGESESWEALFGEAGSARNPVVGGSAGRALTPQELQALRVIPGVQGVVQLTLEGGNLGAAVDGDGEWMRSLAAYFGSSAEQLGASIGLFGLDYAVVLLDNPVEQVLVLPRGKTYLGIQLAPDVLPSMVAARIRDLDRRAP